MRRITAMSRHRDPLRVVASLMHFYGMREPRLYHFGTGACLVCGRLTGREQLVKAVEQLAQAECDHQDLAALVSRPHARTRAGGAGDLDIRVLSAERLEPGAPGPRRAAARCP